MRIHEKKGKNHKCIFCDKSFYSTTNLKLHIVTHDKNREKMFKCNNCDKAYYDKPSLKSHIHDTHEGKRKYKCKTCAKVFSKKSNLKRHTQNVHEGQNLNSKSITRYALIGEGSQTNQTRKDNNR